MLQIKLSVFLVIDMTRRLSSVDILEPIQSRCAMLRYSKLNDEQLLKRLMEIAKAEQVSFTSEGLEAIIFTAQGDMRQVDYLLFHQDKKKKKVLYLGD